MRHEKREPPRRAPAPQLTIIDLNAASVEQIAKVPGIGPAIAEAIVAQRPFSGWDDIRRVPGMSQGLVKQLRGNGVRIGPMLRQAGGA
jgi:DNA uptake protein ComE-like DNA-binding protein